MLESMSWMREPMAKVDTAWLRMERPTNLMMITGVMVLGEPIDVARLKELIAARFLSFRRFRQRVLEVAGQAFWEIDDTFDINWHVRRAALPAPAGKAELEEYVSNLASTPLDHSKPLWQFHLIENYAEGSAIVTRIHHCYADGIALVQVMLSLTDPDPAARHDKPLPAKKLKRQAGVFERLLSPTRHRIEHAAEFIEGAMQKALELGKHPQAAMGSLTDMARGGLREAGEISRELVHALTLTDDPPTKFKGKLGVFKRVAWCPPLPLDEVKAVGKALDATVNDVLLACASGALRAYLIEHGEKVDGLTIRATVPVNLRPLEHAKELGNHFGLVFLDLPIGEGNPLARLIAIRESMRTLKDSRQAVVTLGLLSALGMGPSALQKPAFDLFSRKATTVATNVPGPAHTLFLAGHPISEMMFWVPQTGTIGMGVSILSYAGSVYFGLITDARLVPRPSDISERFGAELEKLLLIALMEDWEAPIQAEQARATLDHYTAILDSNRPAKASRKRTSGGKPKAKPATQAERPRPSRRSARQ